MTGKQASWYWGLWNRLRAKLIEGGMDPLIADEERMEYHRRAGLVDPWGNPRSSRDLTNDEFDRIKAEFLEAIHGKKLIHRYGGWDRAQWSENANKYLDELGIADEARYGYLNGIALRMTGRCLDEISDAQWRDVLAALKYAAFRKRKAAWKAHHQKPKPRPVGQRQPMLAGLDFSAADMMLH